MLNENEVQLASLAVREIRVAVAHSLLHPFGSPPVRRAIEKAYHCLRELLMLRPRITLDFEGERPRVEQSNLEEGVVDSTHVLYEILQSHGIRRITFTQGLTVDELTSFFALLKPRFLPDEKTALQSLQENPIKNAGVNDWEPPVPIPSPPKDQASVPSAPPVVTPATIVSAPAGPAAITFDVSTPLEVAPETEEDIRYQEAEEALERFLEIASEIDSENHRDDLVRKLSGLMKSPEDSPKASEKVEGDWKDLTREFFAFRDDLPSGSKLRQRMDGLLQKWSNTLERVSQKQPGTLPTEARPRESVPAETNHAGSGVQEENPSQLLNPAREAESDAALKSFLDGHRIDRIIPAWVVLWNGVFSGAESVQTLCLRHISRLDWAKLPRPLQMEGFSYFDNFLKAHWPENLRLEAMDRMDAWLRLERETGHLETLVPRAESVRALATDPSTPAILKTRALVFLKSIFPHELLETNYRKLGGSDDEQARFFLRSAGPLAAAFLREHLTALDPTAIDAEEAGRLTILIRELEGIGEKPLDRLLDRLPGERGARILFALSKHMPFPASLAEPMRSQLAQYSVEVRRQALALVESGGRKDLYGWAVELLGDADLDLVRRALKLLSLLHIDGASRYVVGMLETREFPTKESRDAFWVEACQALGDMADPMSIKPLSDWAQSYSILEKRKEKPLLVRRAAIQALGRFRSNQVKSFLEKLINDGDAALIDVVSESHEGVVSKLAQPQEDERPNL
jgi:hypothetical protein